MDTISHSPVSIRWSQFSPLLFLLFLASMAKADDDDFIIDENALFGDTAIMVDADDLTDNDHSADEQKEKSVSISGNVTGSLAGLLNREWFDDIALANTSFNASMLAGLNGDIRLPSSVKSYLSSELQVSNTVDTISWHVREVFVDWNIKHRAFFRLGKQLLQWGRGYLFNPVDLVNVDKKRFLDELQGREGTYGIKVHIPFQTRANLYSFLDMTDVSRIDSIALALKAEFLAGGTEFAFSAWHRKNANPVFGFDFSTGIGEFSCIGECAVHRKAESIESVSWQNFPLASPAVSRKNHDWSPRISLGIGRYFDAGNFNDRILVQLEGMYNGAGNIATDLKEFLPPGFDASQSDWGLGSMLPSGFGDNAFEELQVSDQMLGVIPDILEPNTFSRWYGAAFCTVNRFLITDMTLTANALLNIIQRSALISGGLTYTTLHNLSFTVLVTGHPGPDYTEYNLLGQGMSGEVRVGIVF